MKKKPKLSAPYAAALDRVGRSISITKLCALVGRRLLTLEPPAKSMCAVCGLVTEDAMEHFCNPEERTRNAVQSARMRFLIGPPDTRKRARGYSV